MDGGAHSLVPAREDVDLVNEFCEDPGCRLLNCGVLRTQGQEEHAVQRRVLTVQFRQRQTRVLPAQQPQRQADENTGFMGEIQLLLLPLADSRFYIPHRSWMPHLLERCGPGWPS